MTIHAIRYARKPTPVMIATTSKTSRTRLTSKSKYSASPAQTPAIFRSVRGRTSRFLAVTAPTRTAILAAMKARHLYGSTDDILADFRSGTHFMGESFTTSTPPVFTVRLFGTNSFDSVVVVKDGKIYRVEAMFTYVPYFMHNPWATPAASR